MEANVGVSGTELNVGERGDEGGVRVNVGESGEGCRSGEESMVEGSEMDWELGSEIMKAMSMRIKHGIKLPKENVKETKVRTKMM